MMNSNEALLYLVPALLGLVTVLNELKGGEKDTAEGQGAEEGSIQSGTSKAKAFIPKSGVNRSVIVIAILLILVQVVLVRNQVGRMAQSEASIQQGREEILSLQLDIKQLKRESKEATQQRDNALESLASGQAALHQIQKEGR
ncbi:MAG: hypothetical protein AAFY15_00165, partial [Cyanobacteria bacterium J06648_11]